jgi:hypothetical protein
VVEKYLSYLFDEKNGLFSFLESFFSDFYGYFFNGKLINFSRINFSNNKLNDLGYSNIFAIELESRGEDASGGEEESEFICLDDYVLNFFPKDFFKLVNIALCDVKQINFSESFDSTCILGGNYFLSKFVLEKIVPFVDFSFRAPQTFSLGGNSYFSESFKSPQFSFNDDLSYVSDESKLTNKNLLETEDNISQLVVEEFRKTNCFLFDFQLFCVGGAFYEVIFEQKANNCLVKKPSFNSETAPDSNWKINKLLSKLTVAKSNSGGISCQKSVYDVFGSEGIKLNFNGYNFIQSNFIQSKFICSNLSSRDLAKKYIGNLYFRIRDVVRLGVVINLIKQRKEDHIFKLIDKNFFYESSKNIGFEIVGGDFYVFTLVDSFCLYEKKKKNFFQFPEVKIGIKLYLDNLIGGELDLSSNKTNLDFIKFDDACVMINYAHPSIKNLGKKFETICVSGVPRHQLELIQDFSSRIKIYLSRIRSHFVEGYDSGGSAWHNLYSPNLDEKLACLQVAPDKVEFENITNKEHLSAGEIGYLKQLLVDSKTKRGEV